MLNKLIIQFQSESVELIPWLGGFTQIFEGDEISFAGLSNFVIAMPKRYGFEVTVNDGRQSLYLKLSRMARMQFDPAFNAIGHVTVLDYITPDEGDMTIRQMVIVSVKQVGGSARVFGQNLTKGLTIKLLETTRRY